VEVYVKCKIEGCNRVVRYKGKQLCQMHYFRIMRNGFSDLLPKVRKYRIQNPAGYQKIYEPKHRLANSDGYVYEHRFMVFERYGECLPRCEICGKPTCWETCHIDHIDNDVTNNALGNLRPLCRGCNTFRNYPEQHTISGRHGIAYGGLTMTAAEWARQPGVNVCRATILNRLAQGMGMHEALHAPKKTHNGKHKTSYTAKAKDCHKDIHETGEF
jgi:hypothetical protein